MSVFWFDRRPGLTISEKGILDNSGAFSIGLIPWTDILRITETTTGKQSFINIVVKGAPVYLARQNNPIKRRMMKMNYDMYGSVIGISAIGLKCSHKVLLQLLKTNFNKWNGENHSGT